MKDLSPRTGDLDAAEQVDVEELRDRQLTNLQATLRLAYGRVPHYRAAFDAAWGPGIV